MGRLPGHRRARQSGRAVHRRAALDRSQLLHRPALTYYGRWTYKYEEATRHGAAAAIIIHTTPTASYGWDVVRSSWGREDQEVKLAPGEPALAFAGWVTQGSRAKRSRPRSARHVDELLKTADTRGFRAIDLPLRIRGRAPAKVRTVETRNVIGKIEGSDAKLKEEAVIFSAHWDHLGIGEPVNGDRIYNGALDNASGCGMLLEIARAWAALPQKPRRSVIFLAAAAEEAGLRGSYYYGQHPVIPAGKTAVGLNFDMFLPYGRARDVTVNGAERTTLYPIVQEAAKRMGLTISPDPRPEAGLYYRSDHFSFARVGIPSFSVEPGEDLVGQAAGDGPETHRRVQRQALSSAVGRISRRLGFLGHGAVRAVRLADRRERRELAQTAHLARRR